MRFQRCNWLAPGYFDIEAGRNLGPLTSANSVYHILQNVVPLTGIATIIMVEVLGYGGGDGSESDHGDEDERKRDGRQSLRQDSNSAVQILGVGGLSDQAKQYLTSDERSKLSDH